MVKPKPRGVRVAPLNCQLIRQAADEIRKIFSIPPGHVDIVGLYEFGLQEKGWDYDICEDSALADDVLAMSYPDRHLVRVKLSTWSKALRGDRMCRFTLAHELGHLFLHTSERLGFARHHRSSQGNHSFFEDSEWQADRFAAELLTPAHELLATDLSAPQIVAAYGVSRKSADIRIRSLKDEGYLK